MYSLVSAPVLGFDCARLTGGAELAELLLAALALDEDDLAAVAEQYDADPDSGYDGAGSGMSRSMAWVEVGHLAAQKKGAADVLAAGPVIPDPAVKPAAGDPPPSALREIGLVARLQRAPIGSVDRLIGCIRDDVFAWTWSMADNGDLRVQSETAARAISVICDAAAAAYLRGGLTHEAAERLVQGWRNVSPALRAVDLRLGPHSVEIAALLDRVRTATPDEMRRIDFVGERWRKRQPTWTAAVHDATWAVSLTDRVREAATAQLMLVHAVACADWPLSGLAGGDWNVLSGAVHALVVRDVLAAEMSHRLLGPYVEALGPLKA